MAKLVNRKIIQVLLVGAYPPPVSGNSVHIARLYNLLRAKGNQVQVLDYRGQHTLDDPLDVTRLSGNILSKSFQVFRFMMGFDQDGIVHFHVSAFGRFRWYAPMLLFASYRRKRVITIHSGSFLAGQTNIIEKLYFRLLLSRFDKLIAVNQKIKDSIISLGLEPQRIDVIPAFIKEEANRKFVPDNFHEIHSDSVKVVTSGTLIPIYNYEVLAEVIKNINREKFHFIFAFYKNYDEQYEREILDMLKENSNVTIYRDLSAQEFLAVLSLSNIYVRPSFTDGDSVAVREALAFGKSVFASDYVWRPQGCVLFRNSNELLDLLNSWNSDEQIEQDQLSDSADKILGVYEALKH